MCTEKLSERSHTLLVCGHPVCFACIKGMREANPSRPSQCPMCRATLRPMLVENMPERSKIARIEIIGHEGERIGQIQMGGQPDGVISVASTYEIHYDSQMQPRLVPSARMGEVVEMFTRTQERNEP